MRRRAFAALAAAAVASGAINIPAADAATLEELINANPQWILQGDGAEGLGVDQNENGRLDKGDTLRGVFSFPRMVAQPSGTVFQLDGTTNSALHGFSEVEVAEKTEVSPGVYIFDFRPYAGFEEDFGDGAMAALWESNTPLNSFGCGTKAACEADATAGDIRLVFGFDEEKQNVWGARTISDDIEGAGGVAVGTNIGEYGFRINVLFDDLGVPPFIDQEGASVIAGRTVDFPAQVVGSGPVFGSAGVNVEYPILSDANIRLGVVPVPAALPLFLAGLGALGVIGWRRNAA